MLTVHHIASGSTGNAVLVDDGTSAIMFDAGISFLQLDKKLTRLNYRMKDISGFLITHEHSDHCKAVEALLMRGRFVFMSQGTANAKGYGLGLVQVAESMKDYTIGSFKVKPFDVYHDAEEPFGFLFQSLNRPVKGIYIADTCKIPYEFSGITHWIIECNYAADILEGNNKHESLKGRIRDSHMSLEYLKEFFTKQKEKGLLKDTQVITLIHLSDSNSDEQRFIKELQQVTGVPVFAPRN